MIKNFSQFNEDATSKYPSKYKEELAKEYAAKYNSDFFLDFINTYTTNEEFNEELYDKYLSEDSECDCDEGQCECDINDLFDSAWSPESEIYMLEQDFSNFPGLDIWTNFYNDLNESDWADVMFPPRSGDYQPIQH